MIIDCIHCDPSYFVVYGFCETCGRRCEPPLFDRLGDMSVLDYEELVRDWNIQRSGLISDNIDRTIYL